MYDLVRFGEIGICAAGIGPRFHSDQTVSVKWDPGIGLPLVCKCNLHAAECVLRGTALQCVCDHNTSGEDCQTCARPLTSRPWRPGSYLPTPSGTANICLLMLTMTADSTYAITEITDTSPTVTETTSVTIASATDTDFYGFYSTVSADDSGPLLTSFSDTSGMASTGSPSGPTTTALLDTGTTAVFSSFATGTGAFSEVLSTVPDWGSSSTDTTTGWWSDAKISSYDPTDFTDFTSTDFTEPAIPVTPDTSTITLGTTTFTPEYSTITADTSTFITDDMSSTTSFVWPSVSGTSNFPIASTPEGTSLATDNLATTSSKDGAIFGSTTTALGPPIQSVPSNQALDALESLPTELAATPPPDVSPPINAPADSAYSSQSPGRSTDGAAPSGAPAESPSPPTDTSDLLMAPDAPQDTLRNPPVETPGADSTSPPLDSSPPDSSPAAERPSESYDRSADLSPTPLEKPLDSGPSEPSLPPEEIPPDVLPPSPERPLESESEDWSMLTENPLDLDYSAEIYFDSGPSERSPPPSERPPDPESPEPSGQDFPASTPLIPGVSDSAESEQDLGLAVLTDLGIEPAGAGSPPDVFPMSVESSDSKSADPGDISVVQTVPVSAEGSNVEQSPEDAVVGSSALANEAGPDSPPKQMTGESSRVDSSPSGPDITADLGEERRSQTPRVQEEREEERETQKILFQGGPKFSQLSKIAYVTFQDCECNGHSNRCSFIDFLNVVTCVSCKHNTRGRNCEACRIGYYRDPARPLDDDNVCTECNCDLQGSVNPRCDEQGLCPCKDGAIGRRCDSCQRGYRWQGGYFTLCQNGGTCVDFLRCVCPEDFTGLLCQKEVCLKEKGCVDDGENNSAPSLHRSLGFMTLDLFPLKLACLLLVVATQC
ncbi:Netrin-G2 [Merluccius polli]|uniref:Netrin-G2 n=1 Tax=Merluccius polli TaxID=89951 RepID=A0AA47P1X1_MERPO|nr:Netrin-G2 [Merluccius polli]